MAMTGEVKLLPDAEEKERLEAYERAQRHQELAASYIDRLMADPRPWWHQAPSRKAHHRGGP